MKRFCLVSLFVLSLASAKALPRDVGKGSTSDPTNVDNSTSDPTNEYNSTSDATNEYNSTSDATNEYNSTSDATNEYNSTSDPTNEYNSTSDATNEYNSTSDATKVDNNGTVQPTFQGEDKQNNFVFDGHDKDNVKIQLFDSVSEVRQYVVDGLREIYSTLKVPKNKTDNKKAARFDFEHLPNFEDPLNVGNFSYSYKLADAQFSNIKVIGMQNFHSTDVKIDAKKHTVDVHLSAETLRIVGDYSLSNKFKSASGPFIVKFLGNVTYHESVGYRSSENEVDIVASECGIRYDKSDNDFRDLGFFTQIFRGSIGDPVIEEALKKVGKEIGHKVRPILTSKLYEIALNMNNMTGIETLIRSSVFQLRKLTLKNEYQNVSLDLNATKAQFKASDSAKNYTGTIKFINLSGYNKFVIERLETPIKGNRINVKGTLHNMKMNGTVEVELVEKKSQGPKKTQQPKKTEQPKKSREPKKSEQPKKSQEPKKSEEQKKSDEPKTSDEEPKLRNSDSVTLTLPFNVTDLAINITLKKGLSNDEDRFFISDKDWNVTAIVTEIVIKSQQDTNNTVPDSLLSHLKSVISASFPALVKKHVQSIFDEAK